MAVSPEQLQQAVQQAVLTAAQQLPEAGAYMHQERNLAYTGSGRASGTPARREHKAGGYATAWKNQSSSTAARGLEGLERCLQKLCVCLSCTAWLTPRSERSAGPMLNETSTPAEVSCSTQLYYMLVMLCKGTALTRVVNAGAQESLEAWRSLILHHGSTSLTRSAGLLQEPLNFSFEGETVSRTAQFDRDIDRYQKASGETFRENIRIGVVAGWTTETTPCPQQCSVHDVGLVEGRDRQRQTRTGCCQLDTATNGSVSVSHAESGCLAEGQNVRQMQGEGQRQTQRQCSDSAMLDLWQGWSCKERLLVQHPRWLGGNEQAQRQEQGQRRQEQDPCQHAAVVEQRQEECEVLELQRSGTLLQRLSKEETELVGCGVSTTTVIIIWCDRRDNVEWFLLVCLRGRGRSEQLGTQDCACLGDRHRQWCSKIGGSCWRDSWPSCGEVQRNWSCVHVGHRRARVRSGEAADPGNGGRKGARLERASRASQDEPHECVRHVCGETSCRVRFSTTTKET